MIKDDIPKQPSLVKKDENPEVTNREFNPAIWWKPGRKAAMVLRNLQGESFSVLAKKYSVPERVLRNWRAAFLAGGEDALGKIGDF